MNKIEEMWKFAKCAKTEPQNKEEFRLKTALASSMIEFTPMSNDLDYGYIAEYPDKIVISFRGTRGIYDEKTRRLNLRSWISNFDAFPLKGDASLNNGTICDGFYTGWSFFKPVITDYIKTMLKNSISLGTVWHPIFCTGHSRGGALATLCARHIAKNLKIPCSCISFGAPAQGNSEYRDEINLLPMNHTRCVNGCDIVPCMPPYIAGIRHGGRLLHFNKRFHTKLFNGISDHFYENYEDSIFTYADEKQSKRLE